MAQFFNAEAKVHEIIEKRWSPRAFSDKKIDEDTLVRIIKAAGKAPSCFNEQPWRFLVGIKNEGKAYSMILQTLDKFNQDWAVTAPVLLLLVAKKTFSHNGKVNKHYFYDAGQAAAYLTFQASHEGLFVHQMAGFKPREIEKIFQIPTDFEAVSILAIGYKGDPVQLPENLKKIEKPKNLRKALSEIFFKCDWEKPFNIL